MEVGRSVPAKSLRTIAVILVAAFIAVSSGPVLAAHKLAQEDCYECHAVGGATDMVVPDTRLIKKDTRVIEIFNGGWSTGQPLPCIYCHDDSTIRTNLIGVLNHFSDFSLSKHPVNALVSYNNSSTGGFHCV
jgi:hypothetical protein